MTKTNESGDHIPPFILSFLPWRSIVTPFSSRQTFCVFAVSGRLTENRWRPSTCTSLLHPNHSFQHPIIDIYLTAPEASVVSIKAFCKHTDVLVMNN